MIIIRLFILLVIFSASLSSANHMEDAFNKRDKFKSGTELGDPNKKGSEFLGHRKDVSHLTGLRDGSLIDKGRNELRSSEYGKRLQDSDEKTIEATERYKINAKNSWLKDSLAIEKNPMAEAGGTGLAVTEKISTIAIKKSCTEGVDFNVDVGLELILEVEEEEFLGKPELKNIKLIYEEIPPSWWIKGRYTSSTYHGKNGHGVDMASYTINPSFNKEIAQYIASKVGADIDEIQVDNQDIILTGMQNYCRNVELRGERILYFTRKDNAAVNFLYTSTEKHKRLVEKDEYWQVSTEAAEKLAESNECYEVARVCLKSGVKKFFDKYEVTRPCWYEQISYRCKSEPKDGCAHLFKQDCQLKDSTCEHKIGSICLKWKRDFLCGGKKKELRYSLADSPIYCLGGDCHTPEIEENQDFANVGHLAALSEAHKDCEKESSGMCKNPITVFPGQANSCKKIVTGLIDCCSSMKGWGSNAKLCKCSGDEQGLALKRDRGLCHRVGIYCSETDPVFNKCLVKKTNYCCFNSKLSRIFHEQGRAQLGISWGSAENPDCRAFTLDEFSKIDFSKFDMEELFDDVLGKGKSKAGKKIRILAEGEVPAIQQEHMKTTPDEKRDIRRRAEEEAERERLAKLEEERLEKERLARLKRERLEQEKLAAQEKQRMQIVNQKRLAKQREIKAAQYQSDTLDQKYGDLYWKWQRCNGAERKKWEARWGRQHKQLGVSRDNAHTKLKMLKDELARIK